MKQCCGQDHETNFCPKCGKQLVANEGNLLGLVRQLRLNAKVRLASAQRNRDTPTECYGDPAFKQKMIRSNEAAAAIDP